MKNIVIVDDEQYICNIITETLAEFSDFIVHKFVRPQKAAEFIAENGIDLVLTDLVMGDFSGEKILETTLAHHPDAVVILMTGYPTVKTAISVLKKGGYDYLVKPFKLEDLKATIVRGLDHQHLKRENLELHSQLELMRVTDAVARGMKLQPLLELVGKTATRLLPDSALAILLRDGYAETFTVQYRWPAEPDPDIASFLENRHELETTGRAKPQPYIINEDFDQAGRSCKRSFVSYPLLSRGAVVGSLNLVFTSRFHHISSGQMRLLSLLAAAAASGVVNHFHEHNLRHSYLQTIRALANAIEARDRYTAGHTDRVYRIASIVARKMGWNSKRLRHLKTGCLLHDIGKIGVPDSILNKPGALNEYERNIMKKHPELGAKILGDIPFLKSILPYIISHHERYDGDGYPAGLRGEEIPIEGRLLAVIDTFDAILSDRPYRPGGDPQKALDELIKNKGTQFDPIIVDLFVEAFHEGVINDSIIYGRPRLNTSMLTPS